MKTFGMRRPRMSPWKKLDTMVWPRPKDRSRRRQRRLRGGKTRRSPDEIRKLVTFTLMDDLNRETVRKGFFRTLLEYQKEKVCDIVVLPHDINYDMAKSIDFLEAILTHPKPDVVVTVKPLQKQVSDDMIAEIDRHLKDVAAGKNITLSQLRGDPVPLDVQTYIQENTDQLWPKSSNPVVNSRNRYPETDPPTVQESLDRIKTALKGLDDENQ